MSPQKGDLNRYAWRRLEREVRELNNRDEVLETYVVSGPLFNFGETIEIIGGKDSDKVTIPVPHRYFKSVLTEDRKGNLKMWSFILPNAKAEDPLENYIVSTVKVEQYAGIKLWDKLVGEEIEREKRGKREMWNNQA